jgi:hypothetical protein
MEETLGTLGEVVGLGPAVELGMYWTGCEKGSCTNSVGVEVELGTTRPAKAVRFASNRALAALGE